MEWKCTITIESKNHVCLPYWWKCIDKKIALHDKLRYNNTTGSYLKYFDCCCIVDTLSCPVTALNLSKWCIPISTTGALSAQSFTTNCFDLHWQGLPKKQSLYYRTYPKDLAEKEKQWFHVLTCGKQNLNED